jgi:hypothetical protein
VPGSQHFYLLLGNQQFVPVAGPEKTTPHVFPTPKGEKKGVAYKRHTLRIPLQKTWTSPNEKITSQK